MLNEYNNGCLICNAELEYETAEVEMVCSICNSNFRSNVKCNNGHYVCDECHQSDSNEYIEKYTINSELKNPIIMAAEIMNNPKIKMHGPEHHFMVPAVLISTYLNTINKPEKKADLIELAKNRAKKILGGFCGFYGNCGAGVGTGIFMSIILDSTPFSKEEWGLANLITSECLHDIALAGGPRCCKRNTFLSIKKAIEFIENNLKVKLEKNKITCTYNSLNKECLKNNCPFYKKPT